MAFQVVVMGVSGCGKTTVAGILAHRLGCDLAEADAFHSQANVAKMSAGIPLTDEDRWPWLADIAAWIGREAAAGRTAVVTCSALKRAYRDVLRHASPDVVFLHLTGSRALLAARMQARKGHFMPTTLLDSQLATLEPLSPDERGVTIDVTPPPETIADEALAALKLTPIGARRP